MFVSHGIADLCHEENKEFKPEYCHRAYLIIISLQLPIFKPVHTMIFANRNKHFLLQLNACVASHGTKTNIMATDITIPPITIEDETYP